MACDVVALEAPVSQNLSIPCGVTGPLMSLKRPWTETAPKELNLFALPQIQYYWAQSTASSKFSRKILPPWWASLDLRHLLTFESENEYWRLAQGMVHEYQAEYLYCQQGSETSNTCKTACKNKRCSCRKGTRMWCIAAVQQWSVVSYFLLLLGLEASRPSTVHFFWQSISHSSISTTSSRPHPYRPQAINALLARSDRHSPQQMRHLDFIAQFASDLCHMWGLLNVVADALSRISTNALHTGDTWVQGVHKYHTLSSPYGW